METKTKNEDKKKAQTEKQEVRTVRKAKPNVVACSTWMSITSK